MDCLLGSYLCRKGVKWRSKIPQNAVAYVLCEWSIKQMYHHESEVIFMCLLGSNVSTSIVMRIYGKYRRDIHKYNQCISISTFVQITFSLKYLYACGSAYSCHLRIKPK